MLKMNRFFLILFLIGMILGKTFAEDVAPEGVDSAQTTVQASDLTDIKSALSNVTETIKAHLESLDINSNKISLSIPIPGGRGQIELLVELPAGLEFVEKGFDPMGISFSSPMIEELNVPALNKIVDYVKTASFGKTNLGKIRLFNVILGVGLKGDMEKDLAEADAFKPFFESVRKALESVFKPFEKLVYVENGVGYLKPVYVACIKLALLLKTYLPNQRKELGQMMPLFFSKFLNTVDFDTSSKFKENKTEKKLKSGKSVYTLKPFNEWKKFATYSDPAVLNNLMPSFIRPIIGNLALDVPLDDYYSLKDGITPYLTTMSETYKRGTVDSKAYYFIENIKSLFEKTNMTFTDLYKTSFLIFTMVQKLPNAKFKTDTSARLDSIIDAFTEKLNKTGLSSDLNNWKKSVLVSFAKMKAFINSDMSKLGVSVKDIALNEVKKLSLLELLSYYNSKIKYLLNYKHIGEPGYLFDLSMLTEKDASIELLRMLYRFYKDVKISAAQANTLKSDITVKIDGKDVNIGPDASAKRVGKPGVWDPVKKEWKSKGQGAIWNEQQAQMKMIGTPLNTPEFEKAKAEYSKAKGATLKTRGEYIFDVARGIEIQIGLEKKTPYSAFLADLNIFLRRVEKSKAILDSLDNLYKAVGLPFPKATIEEDVKKSGASPSFFMEEGAAGLNSSDFDLNSSFGVMDF
ncbi:hypothetical protein KJ644_00670 [Candidatus Dependentiae bacterium]|nr:hypothetical protein [Candidatus Dependentiae bacterium]MBU4386967.1 hypothetical protein [Candidatus Dependentiae bacterium]MCG2756716.1 hypothetical protein [Candidatus Dependentiae bacterium]